MFIAMRQQDIEEVAQIQRCGEIHVQGGIGCSCRVWRHNESFLIGRITSLRFQKDSADVCV